jgi:alkylhydroperoxidase family enzyme
LRRYPDLSNLPTVERAIAEFTRKLTRGAYRMTRDDLDSLRAVGFDDTGILQITLIGAWFNYINRVADALGVGRDLPHPN